MCTGFVKEVWIGVGGLAGIVIGACLVLAIAQLKNRRPSICKKLNKAKGPPPIGEYTLQEISGQVEDCMNTSNPAYSLRVSSASRSAEYEPVYTTTERNHLRGACLQTEDMNTSDPIYNSPIPTPDYESMSTATEAENAVDNDDYLLLV